MRSRIRLQHGSLTVLTKVKEGAERALRSMLEGVKSESFFAGWPDVYFARWAILDHKQPAYLLFAVDFGRTASDGKRLDKHALIEDFISRFLGVLIGRKDETFDALYAHCEGYPPDGIRNGAGNKVARFLKRHHHAYTGRHIDFAYRVATPGDLRLAERVRDEVHAGLHVEGHRGQAREFHAKCRERLSSLEAVASVFNDEDIAEREQRHDAAEHDAAWATIAYGFGGCVLAPAAVLATPLLLSPRNRGRILATYAGLAGVVPSLVALSVWLRRRLKAPTPARPILPPVCREQQAQNPMVHVVDIKPGRALRARVAWAKLALSVVNLRAKRYRTGLNVLRTIHFARWVITRTEQGTQLLFLSNYDGSWDSYIGDFVDLLRRFLNAAWCTTRGYPKTWLIAFEGAEDIEPFRCWIRECEVATNVWHRGGNAGRSINNIHNDLQLCDLFSQRELAPEDETRLQVLLRTGLCLTQERMRDPLSAARFLWKHRHCTTRQEHRS